MCSAVPSRTLRQLLDEVEAFCENEAARLSAQVDDAVASAQRSARENLADTLNQSLRRIRHAAGGDGFLTTLADTAAAFCNCAAVFSVSASIVRGERVRGRAAEVREEELRALEFSASQAAAFHSVIETGDPVVALNTAAEVSPQASELFCSNGWDRLHLFPVTGSTGVREVLCAAGEVQISPLELLAQVAAHSGRLSPNHPFRLFPSRLRPALLPRTKRCICKRCVSRGSVLPACGSTRRTR